ncbi:MAG: hypothetical protein AB7G06_02350 [Bdellovibrionales bacterium]
MPQDSSAVIFLKPCLCTAVLVALLAGTAVPAFAQTAEAVPAPKWRVANTIEITELAPEAPGAWHPADRGLRQDMWRGTSFSAWQSLLLGMPSDIGSPTLRDLVAGALFSQVQLPAPATVVPSADVHALRAEAALGATDSADWMMFSDAIPASEQTEKMLERRLDWRFVEDGPTACADVNDITKSLSWQLYCLLAAGKTTEARLKIDMLRESKGNPQEIAIAEALAGADTPPVPGAHDIRTMRLLSLSPDINLEITGGGPLVNRTREFVFYERGGPRGIAAVEWLTGHGALNTDRLAAMYASTAFTNAEKADATLVAALPDVLQRAYIWQQLQETEVSQHAALVNAFVSSGGAATLIGQRGAVLNPQLDMIEPSTASAWAAPVMFALAAAQQDNAAQNAWYALATTTAQTMPEAGTWVARMLPLALTLGLPGVTPGELPLWSAVAPTAARPGAPMPVADILLTLQALDIPVPAEVLQQGGAARVTDMNIDSQQMEALDAAAADGRQGEVILRAAHLTGDNLAGLPAWAAAKVIRALNQVGLPDAARQLAVEYLLHLLYPVRG